jgi:probable phosphoglycerate mutase
MSNPPEIIAHIDGGSRGNPGPAAYGVAIKTPQGHAVTAFARYLGETTNNFAEYQGLLAALDYALSHGCPRLTVMTDSELMARQISGRYKVRSPDLKPLYEKAQAMIARLESFSIRHVYREHNREADRLANKAMDDAERHPHLKPASTNQRSSTRDHPPISSSEEGNSNSDHALLPSTDEGASGESGVVSTPQTSQMMPPKPLIVSATFRKDALHPHVQLPLLDGEEVELVIRRKH